MRRDNAPDGCLIQAIAFLFVVILTMMFWSMLNPLA